MDGKGKGRGACRVAITGRDGVSREFTWQAAATVCVDVAGGSASFAFAGDLGKDGFLGSLGCVLESYWELARQVGIQRREYLGLVTAMAAGLNPCHIDRSDLDLEAIRDLAEDLGVDAGV